MRKRDKKREGGRCKEMAKIINFENEFSSKVDEAQDIAWDAWDTEDPAEQRALAKKALKIDPGCTDAYNILAYEEKNPNKRLGYFMQAIESFKKRYGEKYFEETSGLFWGVLETRPYMRALQGYGQSLWDSGKPKEAVETFNDMLALNPNDNQGVRYILVSWLFIIDDLKSIRRLLRTYKEGTACMLFSALLLKILEKKDKQVIQKSYKAAAAANEYVVPYLLKKKKIPAAIPDRYTLGSKEEAIIYVDDEDGAAAWRTHPEALKVLAELAKEGK
jgi:tetratricopeptide (TPR) repeat protein